MPRGRATGRGPCGPEEEEQPQQASKQGEDEDEDDAAEQPDGEPEHGAEAQHGDGLEVGRHQLGTALRTRQDNCEGGLGDPVQFRRDIAHRVYIDQAISARDGEGEGAAYVAHDPGEAEALGHRVRLIGMAERDENGLYQHVQPCLVPADHPLAYVPGALNAVVA